MMMMTGADVVVYVFPFPSSSSSSSPFLSPDDLENQIMFEPSYAIETNLILDSWKLLPPHPPPPPPPPPSSLEVRFKHYCTVFADKLYFQDLENLSLIQQFCSNSYHLNQSHSQMLNQKINFFLLNKQINPLQIVSTYASLQRCFQKYHIFR